VVKPSEGEQTTKGGIYLPDTAKEKPQEGEVVAVGPGRVSEDGNRIPMELAKGDRVIYSKFAGTEYKDGDDELLILRESDILAKISQPEFTNPGFTNPAITNLEPRNRAGSSPALTYHKEDKDASKEVGLCRRGT